MSCAIIPAAGRSSRMGRPKLLLPLGDTTLIGRLIDSLRSGGVGRIVLVIAPGAGELRLWARERELEIATNPNPERGMLSTILSGVEHLEATPMPCDGPLLISPADVPGISPQSIQRLLAAHPAAAKLIVPTYRGKRGHPLLLAPELISELPHLDPEVGLKQIRDHHDVLEIAVDDPGILSDIDTPEDYERFRAEVSSPDPE